MRVRGRGGRETMSVLAVTLRRGSIPAASWATPDLMSTLAPKGPVRAWGQGPNPWPWSFSSSKFLAAEPPGLSRGEEPRELVVKIMNACSLACLDPLESIHRPKTLPREPQFENGCRSLVETAWPAMVGIGPPSDGLSQNPTAEAGGLSALSSGFPARSRRARRWAL
jgi:hypothetical protein